MYNLFMYYWMSFLLSFLMWVMVLISVAFLTLMERKLLGYIQNRKGPNKLGFIGLIQPFSDAIKLLVKEEMYIKNSSYWSYIMAPMGGMVLILMIWLIYPFWSNSFILINGLIFLMCCFSLSGYMLIFSGWFSNSMYAMLGSVRSLAQSISYEVNLSLILLLLVFLVNSFNFKSFYIYQVSMWFLIFFLPLSILFLISLMAELNRTPFDFSEGESELVSGFNVEYSGGSFVLIFLSEYASILLMSLLYVMFFMGGNFMDLMFYIKIMMLSNFIIWIRGTLPRYRYDELMYFCWLDILPLVLNYYFLLVFIKI